MVTDLTVSMGREKNCTECGISKNDLKMEIIKELKPLLCSCKGNRRNGTSCRRAPCEGTSYPLDLDLVPSVSPNYADSAGILGRKIRELQHQVDHNLAEITFAKQLYHHEVDYLLKE